MTNQEQQAGMHSTDLSDQAQSTQTDQWTKELSLSAAAHICPPGTDKKKFIDTAKEIYQWLKE